MIPDQNKKPEFGYELHKRGADSLVVSLNLFGDIYGVSLTSTPDTVGNCLKNWSSIPRDYPVLFMGEEFIALT